jgi:hypothetical protein
MSIDIKYYHGTSTIFLESIRKNGLGAINPNIDFNNLKVLSYLKDKCERHLIDNKDYEKIRATTIAMAKQSYLPIKDIDGNTHIMNYQHDGIYVSMSRLRAAIYVVTNKYGSEILARCIDLLKLLKNANIDIAIPDEINQFNIIQYIDYDVKPIVIEVKNLLDKDLLLENGGSATEQLNFIRAKLPSMREEFKFVFLQSCNFRILKPISPENLVFYELDYEGYPGTKQFEITLGKI